MNTVALALGQAFCTLTFIATANFLRFDIGVNETWFWVSSELNVLAGQCVLMTVDFNNAVAEVLRVCVMTARGQRKYRSALS